MQFSLEDLRPILFRELDVFVDVCKTHNLTYTILGGTLLGAVRHKGMIPWDDDIDIGMPRQDYEKLISISDSAFPPKYRLLTFRKDKDYFLPYAKLIDMDTSLIERKDLYYHGGAFIDIFPLDGIALKTKRNYKKVVRPFYCSLSMRLKSSSLKSLIRRLCYRLIFFNPRYALTIADKNAKRYSEEAKYLCNYFGAWGMKEISPYDWIFPLKQYSFEGRNLFGPNNADAYLTKLYGNYMQLPPIEKQKSHHSHYFVDLTHRWSIEEIRKAGY